MQAEAAARISAIRRGQVARRNTKRQMAHLAAQRLAQVALPLPLPLTLTLPVSTPLPIPHKPKPYPYPYPYGYGYR